MTIGSGDELVPKSAIATSSEGGGNKQLHQANSSSAGSKRWLNDFTASSSRRAIVLIAQVATDLLALVFAVALAGTMACFVSVLLLHTSFQALSGPDLQTRVFIWIGLGISLCVWFGTTGAYSDRKPLQDDVKSIIGAVSIVLLIDSFSEFVSKEQFSRLWIFLVWPAAGILIPLARVLLRRLLDKAGMWSIGAAVLGEGTHYASVQQNLMNDRYVGYFVAYHAKLSSIAHGNPSVVGSRIASEMAARGAESAILVPSDREIGALGVVMDALNFNLIPYVVIPPFERLPFSGLTIQSIINSDAILMTSRNGLLSPTRRAVKRVFDLVLGSLLLCFLTPLFAVLSILIILNGGTPIFGHQRIGQNGRPFYCLKFRTMAKNADKLLDELLATNPEIAREWKSNFKLSADPRVTPIGRFLRRSSLDELPQLINVLLGDMSLVGPRPVVADELTKYYGDDGFYYKLVRPGITGLWQVSGRSKTSYERRVFLDAWYVRNWNLWMDFVVLFNTIPTALSGSGAH